MFNPEHLVTLRTVVEEGTVVAAADLLGLTPSAVSQQLARLEKEAGQPLMRRRGRNVVPTDAAHVLVAAARAVQAVEERARADLERLRHEVSGPLAVASFPTALRHLAAPALVLLRQRHPDVDPTLHELTPDDGMGAVARGEVGLAVVHDWPMDFLEVPAGVRTELLGTDPCDLLVPAGHPLASRPRVRIQELDGQDWVIEGEGIWSRFLLQSLHDHQLRYRISCHATEIASHVAAVAAGLGLSLVPQLGRERLPDDVVAVPLVRAPTRRVLVAVRRDSARRPVVEAMEKALREVWTGRATVGAVT